MTALNAQPIAPADLWLAEFHQDPPQALERFLLERVYMGRLQRHDPDEILYRLFAAGKEAQASLDAAMCSWFEKYLLIAPPDFSASHWALILQNAFSAVARLNLGQTQDYLRENLRRARAWLRGLYQGPDRDPEAHFLRVLALSQRERDLLPLWMRLCRLEEDRPLHYAALGLLGLQFLPDAQGWPPGDLDDAMFVALRDLANAIDRQASDKKAGKEFWVLKVRALRARFPRSQEYWTEHFFPLVQQDPHSAAARWMGEIVPRLKRALKPGGPRPDSKPRSLPTMQQKKTLLHQLQTLPLDEVRPQVEAFLNAHENYARRTGDACELVISLGQVSAKIYRADPRWALDMVEQAFLWDRHNPHNWMRLAQIAFFCGRWDQAARVLWEAVRLFPEDVKFKNNLAQVLERQGQPDLARVLLQQVMAEFPQDEVCRTILFQTLMAQNKAEEAEMVARDAITEFPQNAVYRNILAQALMAQNKLPEAEMVARETTAEFPQNEVCRTILFQTLMAQNKAEEAKMVARDAITEFPQNAFYRNVLTQVLMAQNKAEEAEMVARETTAKFPQDAFCRNVLAQVLMDQNKLPEAEMVARETTAKFPQDAVCRNVLAQVLMDQNKLPEAEMVARETMAKFPQDSVCRNVLAQVLMDQNKLPEAEMVARETMAKFPQDEVCRNVLKKILEAQDQGEAVALIPPERPLETRMDEIRAFGQKIFPASTPAALEDDAFLKPEVESQKPCFLDSEEKPPVLAPFENGGRGLALAAQASICRQAARRAAGEEKSRYQREAAQSLNQALAMQPDDPHVILEQGYWLLESDPRQAESFFQNRLSQGLQPNVLGYQLGYLRALKRQGKAAPPAQWEELRDRFPLRRTLILLEQALGELGQPNGALLGALKGLKKRLHGRLEAVPNPLKNNEKWVRDRVRDHLFAHLDPEPEISDAALPQIRENFNQFGPVLQGIVEQSLAAQLAD
jgi:predicted Zn-dependent protease